MQFGIPIAVDVWTRSAARKNPASQPPGPSTPRSSTPTTSSSELTGRSGLTCSPTESKSLVHGVADPTSGREAT